MSTSPTVLLIIAAGLLLELSIAGKVYLYDHDPKSGELRNSETLKIGPAQRCHTFTKFGHHVTMANWTDLQEEATLVFYNDTGCQGTILRKFATEYGGVENLRPERERYMFSLMLWESGVYPTRGIVDKTFPSAWMAYYYDD